LACLLKRAVQVSLPTATVICNCGLNLVSCNVVEFGSELISDESALHLLDSQKVGMSGTTSGAGAPSGFEQTYSAIAEVHLHGAELLNATHALGRITEAEISKQRAKDMASEGGIRLWMVEKDCREFFAS
jgi:hypothetical protein